MQALCIEFILQIQYYIFIVFGIPAEGGDIKWQQST
jgi:hypothetical protein